MIKEVKLMSFWKKTCLEWSWRCDSKNDIRMKLRVIQYEFYYLLAVGMLPGVKYSIPQSFGFIYIRIQFFCHVAKLRTT